MIDRRKFLAWAGAGVAGWGFSKAGAAAVPRRTQDGAQAEPPRIRAHRPLGSTGLKVSDIGCGAINLFNAGVLRYAFERGVNHFDTAEGYLNTNSEKMLGQALKDVRQEALITTKHLLRGPADYNRDSLIRRVEASLKRLQTDYLDVALLHSADQPSQIAHEEILAAYARLKKEGKARFVGFSTHAPAVMLPPAIVSDVWNVVLLVYNHMEGPAVEPLIARARAKGIGTIAMKVFAGGMQGSLKSLVSDKVRYSQAALRWALGNPNIDACISTMSTYSHVEEYVAASGRPLERGDKKLLARYQAEAETEYCRVSCRECLSACPHGVAVNEVLRYGMYYEHYGMVRQALDLYGGLEEAVRPTECENCSAPCLKACPYGLDVRGKLVRADSLLSS